jgi:lipid-A-disaccharide synthase
VTDDRPITIFFSAGEPSGDLHGANLIRALRSRQRHLRCIGFGGPLMADAGCCQLTDLTQLAVMWFLRVLLNLHRFAYWLYRAERCLRFERPDAVVLIDFPGFNWWIARCAKRYGIPVYYYAPPQVWAWAQWRVRKMRRLVDHVLCSLPFEHTFYAQHGCRATLVGHPYFDEVHHVRLDQQFVRRLQATPHPLVTILPGSRTQEVEHNLEWFLKAAEQIHAAVPQARFAIAAFKPQHALLARQWLREISFPVEVHVGRTPELIHAATCCMAVSGSVSLELLYHTKPTVIVYWASPLAMAAQRRLRKVKYITLVNLLACADALTADTSPYDPLAPGAEKVLFPEYLTSADPSPQIASHLIEWLCNPVVREERVAQLAELKARVCHPGAARKAAQIILDEIGSRRTAPPAPHFLPGSGAPRAAPRQERAA